MILTETVVDVEDAYELAVVAGLAARLGADASSMAAALAWRDGPGVDLLAEMWEAVDPVPLVEALDACTEGGSSQSNIEDALYDVDDLVAAAVWCGQRERVASVARQAFNIVKFVPDVFAPFAEVAGKMACLKPVAEDLDLYGYWLAVADARELA